MVITFCFLIFENVGIGCVFIFSIDIVKITSCDTQLLNSECYHWVKIVLKRRKKKKCKKKDNFLITIFILLLIQNKLNICVIQRIQICLIIENGHQLKFISLISFFWENITKSLCLFCGTLHDQNVPYKPYEIEIG